MKTDLVVGGPLLFAIFSSVEHQHYSLHPSRSTEETIKSKLPTEVVSSSLLLSAIMCKIKRNNAELTWVENLLLQPLFKQRYQHCSRMDECNLLIALEPSNNCKID